MSCTVVIPNDGSKALELTRRTCRTSRIKETSFRKADQLAAVIDTYSLAIIACEVATSEVGKRRHHSMPPHSRQADVTGAEPTEIFEVGVCRGRFRGERHLIFIIWAARKTVRTAKGAKVLQSPVPGPQKRVQAAVGRGGEATHMPAAVKTKRLAEGGVPERAEVNHLIVSGLMVFPPDLSRRGNRRAHGYGYGARW